MIVDIIKNGKIIQKAILSGQTVDLDSLPLQNKLICLDPGHGGSDRANIGYSGKYIEADGVLEIAKLLATRLEGLGAEVVLTRDKDKTLSLSERCKIANNSNCDIFISIHTDACSNPNERGATIFYSLNPLFASKKLGEAINEEYFKYVNTQNRGVKFKYNSTKTDDYYGVLRGTNMPAIIIECGFHTNSLEEARLLNRDYKILIAEGIKQGIVNYFIKK